MENFIVNEELKNLLPPLPAEELAGLEASILESGCLTPLVVWNNILVDGHYRYEICSKYGIPFSIKTIPLESFEDAKVWAWQHQENRRNLTPFHRAELALKFKEVIARKARENQRMAGGRGANRIPGKPIDTASELAQIAGVSHATLHRVEYLSTFADEETKNRLRRGDKGTSINREYDRLRMKYTDPHVTENPCPSAECKIVLDEKAGMLHVRNDVTPEELAAFIVEHFPAEFVRDLIRSLLKEYDKRYGNEATQQFLLKNCVEYID